MSIPFKMKGFSGFKDDSQVNDSSPVKLQFAKGDGVHPGTRGLKLFNISRKRRTKTRKNIVQKITDSDWNQRQKIKEERRRVKASKDGGSNTRTIANPNASSYEHKYFRN